MKLRDHKMKALVVTALDRFEPLRILVRHLMLFVVIVVAIVGLALAAYLFVPVRYVATGTVLVGDPEPGVAQSAVDAQKTGDPADMESQLIIAHSQVVLRRALLLPKAQKALQAECMAGDAAAFGGDCNDLANRPDKLVDYVSSRYGVGSVGRSRIITISYTSPQPEVASDMANALIEAFLEEQKETVSASRETAADWLKKEANALDTEIRRLDRQIAEYRGEKGLVRGTGGPATSELLTGVNQQLAAAQALQATAAARLKEINAADLGGSANATAVLESRTVGDIKQKIADIDSRLGTAAATLGPSHPRLKALVGERKALDSRLSAEIDRIAKNARKQYTAATERVAVLTRQMQAAKAEVTVATDGETSIEDLVRKVEVKRRQFADLSTRINGLEVEQRVRSGNVRLVSEADVPRKPFFPKKIPFAAAGLTLGLLAGAVAAFVAEKINPAPENRIAEDLPRSPVAEPRRVSARREDDDAAPEPRPDAVFLAAMPQVPLVANRAGPRRGGRMLVEAALASKAAQKALDAIGAKAAGGVVAVASLAPGAGRSTLVAALARRAAASGTAVLVIDCNLSRPAIAGLLDTPRETDRAKDTVEDLVLQSPFDGLDVVPAAHARRVLPPEYRWETRLADLLQWARTAYDLVLLDGPSLDDRSVQAVVAKADMVILCALRQDAETEAAVSRIQAVKPVTIGIVATHSGQDRRTTETPPLKKVANQGWR
ncbi:exopolysaccharide transport family protein [Shinella sp. S4-D37]|uniref:GumC family protein n=1 Tax=Shinella sp. S4-D37 TaxID=3161999 RepID=UPI003466299D